MCNFCDIEKGNSDLMVSDKLRVVYGDRELDDHSLDTFFVNGRDGYSIDAGYFVDGGNPVAKVRIHIYYCPFCGKQLTQREIKKYPWN